MMTHCMDTLKMPRRITSLKKQQGYLALLAVLMILVIGVLGSNMSNSFFSGSKTISNYIQGERAFLIASAGAEQASRYVLQKSIACSSITGNSDLTNASFDAGKFTVTGVSTVASNTLNGAITSNATSLSLNSSSGFAASGLIKIDNEIMRYQSISGNDLTGLVRGLFTTSAASHASSASVSQSQCSLDSVGGIPSVASPLFKKEVIRVIPQFSNPNLGFAVGPKSSGDYVVAKFDGTNWTREKISGGEDLQAVSIGSSNYAITTGHNGVILAWNGSNWFLQNTRDQDQNSADCISGTDCHVGGDETGDQPTFADYNGSSWQSGTVTGSMGKSNIQALSCASSSNCWGVGDAGGGKIFYQFSGGGKWTGYTNTLSSYPYKGVFCNTNGTCWAVGANNTFAYFNGSSWSTVSTSLPNVQYNSVFCTATNFCVAVGNNSSSKDTIATYDGSTWTLNTNYPTPVANLYGVACTNSKACWAVGGSVSGSNPTFVQWDGTTWKNVTVSGMPSGVPLYGVDLLAGAASSIPSNSGISYQVYP